MNEHPDLLVDMLAHRNHEEQAERRNAVMCFALGGLATLLAVSGAAITATGEPGLGLSTTAVGGFCAVSYFREGADSRRQSRYAHHRANLIQGTIKKLLNPSQESPA